jgi:hypothetical protein
MPLKDGTRGSAAGRPSTKPFSMIVLALQHDSPFLIFEQQLSILVQAAAPRLELMNCIPEEIENTFDPNGANPRGAGAISTIHGPNRIEKINPDFEKSFPSKLSSRF